MLPKAVVDELRERSKNDNAIIVGSEIRQLCGEIDRLKKARLNDLEAAWGIIANAFGGDWGAASPEWKKAAERWRDEVWHPALDQMKDELGD